MIDIFKQQLQREHTAYAQTVIDALEIPAPVSVRLNPHKFSAAKHALPAQSNSSVPWEPGAVYLSERPVFTMDPLFHAGAYYVQEASSMWLGETVRRLRFTGDIPSSPLRVLDLCAAPGGKSTHLAAALDEHDLLVANEVHRTRAQVLTENLIKWGYPNVVVTSNETRHFQSLGSFFDLILVDAPCSGEGLFRRDPDAVSHWSPESVTMCSTRQNQILDEIWPVLKPGGVLIYSTCTFNRSENDEQISRMIGRYGASCLSIGNDASEELIQEVHPNGVVINRCMPGITRGEGFTFSVLRKPDDAGVGYGTSRGTGGLRKVGTHAWIGALDDPDAYTILANEKQSFAVHKAFKRDVTHIGDSLYIHHTGVELGDERRVGQSLGMSIVRSKGYFTELEMDTEQAIRYLRRESVDADRELSGIILLTHGGLGLGFGKATRGRINNHYPQEWRIRMR
jgi:16S rRNA C967 or C1407 C5-methylase (RsmB/RsmF family)/NOL1/NOP2/fmu family ribosome biogenesis protein